MPGQILHRFGPLLPGRFIRRRKRFLADIELQECGPVVAHCPNTGSMKGLLHEDAPVMVSPAANPNRTTAFTWELVRAGRTWVAVNTALTNELALRAIRGGCLKGDMAGGGTIRREVGFDSSRIDFLLCEGRRRTWLEVKSVTMCDRGRAAFPDAVTVRGLRHLECLAKAVRNGDRAAILFLVQRGDARFFEAAEEIDHLYAAGLARAAAAGVRVVAAALQVSAKKVMWRGTIPVRF